MPVKRTGEALGDSDPLMGPILLTQFKAACGRLICQKVVWVAADDMNRRQEHNYRKRPALFLVAHGFQLPKICIIYKILYAIDSVCYEFKECQFNRLPTITVYPQTMGLINGLSLKLGICTFRMNV
jgi:hypothetical protein